MNAKPFLKSGLLALTLVGAAMAASPAAAVDTADCVQSLCAIRLQADALGHYKLEVPEALDCNTDSSTGSLIAGQALALQVTCVDLGIFNGRTCWGVAAETETNDNADASADIKCNGLSASCSSSSSNGGHDSCYDDDYGTGSAPITCDLYVWAAWWDYGSSATAACYVGYNDAT